VDTQHFSSWLPGAGYHGNLSAARDLGTGFETLDNRGDWILASRLSLFSPSGGGDQPIDMVWWFWELFWPPWSHSTPIAAIIIASTNERTPTTCQTTRPTNTHTTHTHAHDLITTTHLESPLSLSISFNTVPYLSTSISF